MTDDEVQAARAAYYVGLFCGGVSDDGAKPSPAYMAHALWILAREAERVREMWLVERHQQELERDQ